MYRPLKSSTKGPSQPQKRVIEIDLCDDERPIKKEHQAEQSAAPRKEAKALSSDQSKELDSIHLEYECIRRAEQYSIEEARQTIEKNKQLLINAIKEENAALARCKEREAVLEAFRKEHREKTDQMEANLIFVDDEERCKQIKDAKSRVEDQGEKFEDVQWKGQIAEWKEPKHLLWREASLDETREELEMRLKRHDLDSQRLVQAQNILRNEQKQLETASIELGKKSACLAKEAEELTKTKVALEREREDCRITKQNYDTALRRETNEMKADGTVPSAREREVAAIAAIIISMREHLKKLMLPSNEDGASACTRDVIYIFRRNLSERIGDLQTASSKVILENYGVAMELCVQALVQANEYIGQHDKEVIQRPSKKEG